MNLITKLGLVVVGLGISTNIAGRILSNHYNNQKEKSVIVLENTIKTNSLSYLDEAISNFEKCERNRSNAENVRYLSYIMIPLGGAIALGGKKIRINIDMI